MSSAAALPPCVDHTNRAWKLLATAWSLWSVAFICVLLRFYSRWSVKAGYWFDDWLIIFPLLVSLAWSISCSPLVGTGFGKHFECADPDAIPWFLKTLLSWEFLYTAIISTVKYSIILFYWRVFNVPSFKKYLWGLTFLVTGWAIGVIVASAVTCVPIQAFWRAAEGTCINLKAFFVGNAVPNILTDFLLLMVPLPYIYRLHTPKSYKVALAFVFACGGLVITISIVRLYSLYNTSEGPDVTWEDLSECIWTVAEINTAIICANLPSFGPLLKTFLEGTGIWTKGSHQNTSYLSNGGTSRGSVFKALDSKNARHEYPMDNFVPIPDDGDKASDPEAGHGTVHRMQSYDDDDGVPLRITPKRTR